MWFARACAKYHLHTKQHTASREDDAKKRVDTVTKKVTNSAESENSISSKCVFFYSTLELEN